MRDLTPRIEPQYLLAAAQSSMGYYQAIWQKMGLILLIQLSGLTAAYSLHKIDGGSWVFLAAFIFSCGPLAAAEYDIRNRDRLLTQAGQIARTFGTGLAEHMPGINFELEPFKVDELFPARRIGYTGWLLIRIALLALIDLAALAFIRSIP